MTKFTWPGDSGIASEPTLIPPPGICVSVDRAHK